MLGISSWVCSVPFFKIISLWYARYIFMIYLYHNVFMIYHWHPCCADQWRDRERYPHSGCWQNGPTLSCIYGLFIYGRWWGVHCHYVSHDTVRKLLVSQGTTAGLRPCVPFQRHTGDSRWVGNWASAAAESRWNGTWQVQGQGTFLMAYIMFILDICMSYTVYIPCISKKYELHMQKI